MKDLTKVSDLTPGDVSSLLKLAFECKNGSADLFGFGLSDKVVAMIFEKPSLRTKVAFEVAAASLGMTPVFLSSSQILASGGNEQGRESVSDIARNLERFADLLLARVYDHRVIEELTQAVQKPVINALCNLHHPTQALADLMTIQWHKEIGADTKVVYIGDGNNVATSLAQICALVGMPFSIATPPGYAIPAEQWQVVEKLSRTSGVEVFATQEPSEAVAGADVVYTDTFVSMGQEKEYKERITLFEHFRVTKSLMSQANEGAIFMHCLPAHRGEEVEAAVIDGDYSVVFDQAECRMHIAKSLYVHLLGKN